MISGNPIKKVKGGDPYRPADQNKIVDEVMRLGRFTTEGAEGAALPGGTSVSTAEPEIIFAKVTAVSSHAYAWQEVFAATGGTWAAGVRTGSTTSDAAYEANSVVVTSSLFPFYAILRRPITSYNWIFFADQCQSCS
jgi:hypothetical protein